MRCRINSMKKLLLITLIIFSANSIAEDVGLKCDTESKNSPRPPATKLFLLKDSYDERIYMTKKNVRAIEEFNLLEGEWSYNVRIKETSSSYQFYFSNGGYKANKMRVSYTLNRSNLSMVSHEEKCVATDYLNYDKCTQYKKITQYSYWECRKMSKGRIREYAAEALKEITKDNQI